MPKFMVYGGITLKLLSVLSRLLNGKKYSALNGIGFLDMKGHGVCGRDQTEIGVLSELSLLLAHSSWFTLVIRCRRITFRSSHLGEEGACGLWLMATTLPSLQHLKFSKIRHFIAK